MALAMANVVEIGRGQLMGQVRRVESCCVANAQTLFLITTVIIRKYEDVCLALSTSALSFPTISFSINYPILSAFRSPFSTSPKMALERHSALLCCCE